MPSENTRRIAKNSAMLYIRMLLVMAVTLYTSRVVLKVLGVEDFGIYNVVGGIVAFLGFFTSSLSNASQRYLSIGLGKGDLKGTNRVFCQSVVLYFLISVSLVFVGEIVGVWFVENKLVVPPGRENAAWWVFQFSLLTVFLSINQVAFVSAIIARERMSVYAYLGLFEVFAKLLAVYLLLRWSEYDRLIVYAALTAVVYFFVFLFYVIFCLRKFPECKIRFYWDRELIRKMLGFISYNVFGCFGWAAGVEGSNILLNLFFGPLVNASRGIAVQVNAAVVRFTDSITTAVKPQIIKSYAVRDFEYLYRLINKSSVYSYLFMFLLAVPVLFETSFILNLWLGEVPDYAVVFTRLTILESLLGSFVMPLWLAANATGKIKKMQVHGRFITLLALPLSYLVLKYYPVPLVPMVMLVIAQLVYWLYCLYDIHKQISLDIRGYCKEVIYPSVKISCLVMIGCGLEYFYMQSGFIRFFVLGVTDVSLSLIFAYLFAMGPGEKAWLRKSVVSRLTGYFYHT